MLTPVYTLLHQQAQQGHTRFCMPGHKGQLNEYDVTEAGEMDNLLHPKSSLASAQTLLAQAYGAKQAWFGTCGTTMGNYALIHSCAQENDLVLIASDCHLSVIHAAMLSRYRVSLISCDETKQDLPLPISVEKVRNAIVQHPEAKAVIITSPNYYGLCAEIPEIASLCHEHGMLLLIDAAHGAHFGFSPLLPSQPIQADGWVVSAHKTLCVSNQGSMIFLGKNSGLDVFRVENNVHRFQSTSPSWPLIAQMDLARALLCKQGNESYQSLFRLIHAFELSVQSLGIFCIQKPSFQKDFSRLVLDISQTGYTGFELSQWLSERGIWIEMADIRHLVLICTPQDTKKDFDTLYQSLSSLPSRPISFLSSPSLPRRNEEIFVPASVEYGTIKTMPLSQSIGKISARAVCCYPPGTAVLCPGEQISIQQADYLYNMQQQGASISGCAEEEVFDSLSLYVMDSRPKA